jgi:hypothetical protein
MEENKKAGTPQFNGVNEHDGLRETFENEHNNDPEAFAKTGDELSLGDSVRTYGEVSGTTFGMQSNTAKFSNIGQKNQERKGEGDANVEDVNNANKEDGSGGTMYSDYLNKAQNEFISGTGQFDPNASKEDYAENNGNLNPNSTSIRPFDAMQGNREQGSGGRSEQYEGYDPSGAKRPNE